MGPIEQNPKEMPSLNLSRPIEKTIQNVDSRIRAIAPQAIRGSEVENWDADFETTIDEKWVVPIPPGTPISSLVVFKDEYSGPMPLNAIKESEFSEINKILEQIKNENTCIKFDDPSEEFKNNCCQALEKICHSATGRDLVKQLVGQDKEIKIRAGKSPQASPRLIVEMDFTNPFYMRTIESMTNKPIVVRMPNAFILAHELMHILHFLKGEVNLTQEIPSNINQEFHNIEEQITISGLHDNIKTPISPKMDEWSPSGVYSNVLDKTQREDLFEQAADSLAKADDNSQNVTYNPINENRLQTSLGQIWRMDHGGVGLPDISLTNKEALMHAYRDFPLENDKAIKEALKGELRSFFLDVANSGVLHDPKQGEAYLMFAGELGEKEFVNILLEKEPRFPFDMIDDLNRLLERISPDLSEKLIKLAVSQTKHLLSQPAADIPPIALKLSIMSGDQKLADQFWEKGVRLQLPFIPFVNAKDPQILNFLVHKNPGLINLRLILDLMKINDFASIKEYLGLLPPKDLDALLQELVKHTPPSQIPRLLESSPSIAKSAGYALGYTLIRDNQFEELVKTVELLKDRGWNVNSTDDLGNTLLHRLAFAANKEEIEPDDPVFQKMVDLGMDPNILNSQKKSPFQILGRT